MGIAWESGLLAGLAGGGVRVGDADLFVGTSAGSVVGAQVALGREPGAMVAPHLAGSAPTPRSASPSAQGAPDVAPNLTGLMELMARSAAPGADPDAMRLEIGRFALAAHTISEEQFIESFGAQLSSVGDWPAGNFVCTAVDCESGEFRAWDRAADVRLGAAVASSCSVPGIYPPITIQGRRYMDGGMRSGTNADLATGYDRVIVIALTTGRAPAGATPTQLAMAAHGQKRLDDELDALRTSGSEVELITPDPTASEAFGPNLMDFRRRKVAAENGIRQGETLAGRLRAFWTA